MSGAGGVDDTIALKGNSNSQDNNPLNAAEKFAGIQNSLNRAKMFPGELQLQQQSIDSNQGALVSQQRNLANQALVPLLAKKGNLTIDDITNGLAGAERSGYVTQPALADFQGIQLTGDPATDNATIRAHILANTQSPANAAKSVLPNQGQLDTGPAIQPTLVGAPGMPDQGVTTPAGGSYTKGLGPQFVNNGQGQVPTNNGSPTGNGIQMQLTPAELAQQVGRPANEDDSQRLGVPVGTALTETMLQRLQQQGFPNLPGGAPQQGGMGGVSGVGGPVSPKNPPRLNQAPAPAGGKPVVSGLAPGATNYNDAQGTSLASATDRATHYASDMYPMLHAQQALAAAPTGKGSQALHDSSAYLQTFAPGFMQKAISFISPVMSSDEIAAYDEAKKYTSQMQLGSTGAGRSNEGLAAAGAANPSPEISPKAAQVLLKGMIGLRRMEQDGTLAFQNSGQGPAQYGAFMTKFSTAADPRVYQFDTMTPAQRQSTLDSIKEPKRKAAFMSQVQRAENNGVLSAPAPQQ